MNLLWTYCTFLFSPESLSLTQPSSSLVRMNSPTANRFSGMFRSAWISFSAASRFGPAFMGAVFFSRSATRNGAELFR